MARTILITGIAGFIGSHLAHSALAQGYDVRGIDDFSSGHEANLAPFGDQIQLLRGSVTSLELLRHATKGVDCVFHHAAIVSVPQSMERPVRNHDVNLGGTMNVLLAAREAGVRRVVFASSSSVYGEPTELPIGENTPADPLSPYAVSKASGELYMRMFSRSFGVETVCLRYFNVYGPRQDPTSPYSGVLARFIMQMSAGLQPTIFGDGNQTRDFVYVNDIASANLLACSAPSHRVNGRVFNVATGRGTSLNRLYAILQGITGYRRPPLYAEPRLGDIRRSVADIASVRESLDFSPSTSIEEGVSRTVEWSRACFDAPRPVRDEGSRLLQSGTA